MNVMEILHWIPVIVMLFIVGCLFVGFFKKYWKPAKNLKAVLDAALNEVKSNTQHQYLASTLKHNLTEYFKDTPFTHAWQMYQQTLHDSYKQIDGENQLVSTRSTVPSGYFFEQSTLVDTPLKVDFYKHLPGIITGLAIVATFSGLFIGLWSFDPAGDPANIQASLKALLQSVMAAFIASGLAIFIAMLITWKEKAWLRECYATLEQLTTEIDKLFDADDIGEEYLDRLVHRVESTETAIKNIKDSLIDDLKPAIINGLGAMADKLIAENRAIQAESNQQMADAFGQSIQMALQQPLQQIVEVVKGVSQDQGQAVHGMLSEVLKTFTNQLQSTVGGQMQGLAEMMEQSVTTISDMRTGFVSLIRQMQTTSEESGQRLQEKMVEILGSIEERQTDMTRVIEKALSEMQHSVKGISDVGVNSTREMLSSMTSANDNVQTVFSQLVEKMGSISEESSQRLQEKMVEILGSIEQKQSVMTDAIQDALDAMQSSVKNISEVGVNSTERMLSNMTTTNDNVQTAFSGFIEQMQVTNEASSQKLQEKMVEILDSIERKQSSMTRAIQDALNTMQSSVTNIGDAGTQATTGISSSVSKVNATMEILLDQLGKNITELSHTTTDNIRQMNLGADKMDSAAQRFSTAGQILTQGQEAITTLMSKANDTTTLLNLSSQAILDTQNKMNLAMQTISTLMGQTQQESEYRQKSLETMQILMGKFEQLNQDVQHYLQHVNQVLTNNFTTFSDASSTSLNKTLGEYDKALSGSIDRLKEATSGLTDVIEDIDSTVSQLKRRI